MPSSEDNQLLQYSQLRTTQLTLHHFSTIFQPCSYELLSLSGWVICFINFQPLILFLWRELLKMETQGSFLNTQERDREKVHIYKKCINWIIVPYVINQASHAKGAYEWFSHFEILSIKVKYSIVILMKNVSNTLLLYIILIN